MEINQRKMEFSRAYVQAVAAAAGLAVSIDSVDDDSIDIRFAASSRYIVRAPRVEAQLKCTQNRDFHDDHLRFDLTLKNYEDLSVECNVPRILVVVVVPPLVTDWLLHDEDSTVMQHCGYWMSLADADVTTNETSVRVKLPRHQLFNVPSLLELMHESSRGRAL